MSRRVITPIVEAQRYPRPRGTARKSKNGIGRLNPKVGQNGSETGNNISNGLRMSANRIIHKTVSSGRTPAQPSDEIAPSLIAVANGSDSCNLSMDLRMIDATIVIGVNESAIGIMYSQSITR